MATFSKTGQGALGVLRSKTNISESARTASGLDSITHVETGSVISARTASGVRATIVIKTGIGENSWVASGLDNVQNVETGIGQSPRVASGVKSFTPNGNTYNKTGRAILGAIPIRPGTAVLTNVASGVDSITYNEVGIGSADRAASGSKSYESPTFYTKSGGGAGGSGTPTYGLLSLALPLGWQASGVKSFTSAGPQTFTKTGMGVRIYTGNAPRRSEFSEASMGLNVRSATGPDALTSTEAGQVISVRNASGTDSVRSDRASMAVVTFTASGARSSPGNVIKSGSGVLDRQITGDGFATYHETGLSAIVRTAAGTYTRLIDKTGTATSAKEAASARIVEHITKGGGVTNRTGSSSRTLVHNRSGQVVAIFVGSGKNDPQQQHIKTGQGTYTWTADSTLDQGPSYEKFGKAAMGYQASGTMLARVPLTLILKPTSINTNHVVVGTPVDVVRTIKIDGTDLTLVYN